MLKYLLVICSLVFIVMMTLTSIWSHRIIVSISASLITIFLINKIQKLSKTVQVSTTVSMIIGYIIYSLIVDHVALILPFIVGLLCFLGLLLLSRNHVSVSEWHTLLPPSFTPHPPYLPFLHPSLLSLSSLPPPPLISNVFLYP
jgi:hypothetical protein